MRAAILVLAVVTLLGGACPSLAADNVDLALVLVVDVSRSIDDAEFHLERQGYVAAFTAPEVLRAIRSGPSGVIAVSFIEFAGATQVKIVVDWTVLRDDETAAGFAEAIDGAPRSYAGFTSISAGIDGAVKQLASVGVEAARRAIDVSGDGTNNSGRDVNAARDDAVAAGITINGLAIINAHPATSWYAHVQPPGGLAEYYRRNVTGGPGSFVVTIKDFHSFAEAIKRKLISEIAEAGP